MDFNDRFVNSNLSTVDLSTISEEQLRIISPLLYEMVVIIRGFSVLLKRKTIQEIYDVITNQSDPRIALVLAAARDNSGNQLFPTLTIVKAFMFGSSDDTVVNADVRFNDKSIFVNGIKRISCALTAAYLIGQLSQVPEQAQHAIVLEKQALDDLNKLLQVPEVKAAAQQLKEVEQSEKPRLYFQPANFNLGSRVLKVSVYLSAISSNWSDVSEYSNTINLSTIVADLADYINSVTLNSSNSNILASAILSGKDGLHILEFDSRLRNIQTNTELVSIKFNFIDESTLIELPFKWGIDKLSLLPYAVNSCLVQVDKLGNLSSIPTDNDELVLDTIYFRKRDVDENGVTIVISEDELTTLEYRISPTQLDSNFIDIEYDPLLDRDRPNLVATALLNSLFELKDDTKALGAIIQNDPTTMIKNQTALQLVAWTVTNKEVELVLDIIELPPDIEIALGDVLKPITSFSNKPRSLKVKTKYEKNLNTEIEDLSNSTYVKLVKGRQSKLLAQINDIKEFNYKSYRRSLNYKDPYITIPNPYPYE